jgi:hypothetical protein
VNPESWPRDRRAIAALVALVVADIHDRDALDNEIQLAQFLRTAWPSPLAQCQ